MNIYRIVQEAFQNIKKHAKASEVTVLFKQDKVRITVAIQVEGGATYRVDAAAPWKKQQPPVVMNRGLLCSDESEIV